MAMILMAVVVPGFMIIDVLMVMLVVVACFGRSIAHTNQYALKISL